MSSSIEVIRGRARVEVEADLWGDYGRDSIRQLRLAVQAACRAIDTDDARELAATLEPAPPNKAAS